MKQDKLINHLQGLYGTSAAELAEQVTALAEQWRSRCDNACTRQLSERDAVLIVYGDSFQQAGQAPLETLRQFMTQHIGQTISGIHLLPMFPYTSDDGFSVVDYRSIDPALGSWSDIERLSKEYDLIFDAVINHTSKSCRWFQGFLDGDAQYHDYYIEGNPDKDYSAVVRPRTLPLLTPFASKAGVKLVWTTFSDDQVDLNFKSHAVLLEVLDLLAWYASQGARYIRLDAITYAWKQEGTGCANLEQTHLLIKLFRMFLNEVAPDTMIITETNVPHSENIAYMGNGTDEANMVYQFPLPPLVLHTYLSGSVQVLHHWLSSLETPQGTSTYFNFLASHDGIGMQPVKDILSVSEQKRLVVSCVASGGRVGYKTNTDGTQSVYELNVNYQDVLTPYPAPEEIVARRFLGAQFIMLSLQGVPGIYYHSLLGSHNDAEAVEESGINRRINRKKLTYAQAEAQIAQGSDSVFNQYIKLLACRRMQSAFSPDAAQTVVELDKRAFSVLRTNEMTGQRILAVVNVSGEQVELFTGLTGTDLLSNRKCSPSVTLKPYAYRWILADN